MASHRTEKTKAAAAAEHVQNKSAKKKQIERLIQRIESAVPSEEELEDYARCMVDPRGALGMVMPSPTPTRAGVAKFPLVVEVTSPTDFGIIVRPDFEKPLVIFEGTAAAESANALLGSFSTATQANQYPVSFSLGSSDAGPGNSVLVQGVPCYPLVSSAGATLSITLSLSAKATAGIGGSSTGQEMRVLAYDGSTWLPISTLAELRAVGDSKIASVAWTSSYTHISFQNSKQSNFIGGYDVKIAPTVGTCTMVPLGSVSTGVVHRPAWAGLLDASKRARVVAADCLVTFEGSALANGGSIAVCNTDDDLVISGSFYETIASQPFDMYRGRLASQGETEGGAHWHYIPDNPEQFCLRDLDTDLKEGDQVPEGYFGIKGKAANEVVRIECHFVVNFFSSDPSYHMEITPCFAMYPRYLWAMRDLIPLVSSNDSHLKKLKRLGKAGLRKGMQAAQFAQDHEADIAKALSLMATLL